MIHRSPHLRWALLLRGLISTSLLPDASRVAAARVATAALAAMEPETARVPSQEVVVRTVPMAEPHSIHAVPSMSMPLVEKSGAAVVVVVAAVAVVAVVEVKTAAS
jgi:hypothetical protein